MPQSQTAAFITLNEAVTQLAFGEAQTPGEYRAQRKQENAKIRRLIDRCLVEVSADATYAGFPSLLSVEPLNSLIFRLEEAPSPRPPSYAWLLKSAKRLTRERRRKTSALIWRSTGFWRLPLPATLNFGGLAR